LTKPDLRVELAEARETKEEVLFFRESFNAPLMVIRVNPDLRVDAGGRTTVDDGVGTPFVVTDRTFGVVIFFFEIFTVGGVIAPFEAAILIVLIGVLMGVVDAGLTGLDEGLPMSC